MKNKVKNYIKKLYSNDNFNVYIIVVILFSLFVFSKFVTRGYILGDDTEFHLPNILVSKFSFFSKIVPIVGGNLGYGIGIFYPMLPHALGGIILFIISKIGFGPVAAIKIVKLILILFSSISMYFLSSKLFKSKRTGMISAILYISSSYFIVDIFQRDALNESFVFAFMPLVFLGLYYLLIEKNDLKFYLFFVIGYICLIYSHLVMTVWLTLLLIPFVLLYAKDIFNKNMLKKLVIASGMILIFTSSFTIPLIEHMLKGNYAIFNASRSRELWTIEFKEFFMPVLHNSLHTAVIYFNISIVTIIFFILTIIRLIKDSVNKERKKMLLGLIVMVIIGMTMCSFNKFWIFIPQSLKAIQFGWRGAVFVVFGLVLVASESLEKFYNCFKSKKVYIGSLIILLVCINSVYNQFKLINIYDTVNSSNSEIAMGHQKEYLPQKAMNNIDYFHNRKQNIVILKGDAKVKVISNNTPNLKFEVKNIKKPVVLELPRLYYLGYQITAKDENNIKYYEDNNGFIKLKIDKDGIYKVKYTGTTLYKISLITKVILIIIIIAYIVRYKREDFKKQIV